MLSRFLGFYGFLEYMSGKDVFLLNEERFLVFFLATKDVDADADATFQTHGYGMAFIMHEEGYPDDDDSNDFLIDHLLRHEFRIFSPFAWHERHSFNTYDAALHLPRLSVTQVLRFLSSSHLVMPGRHRWGTNAR